jgi:hypothetical protein
VDSELKLGHKLARCVRARLVLAPDEIRETLWIEAGFLCLNCFHHRERSLPLAGIPNLTAILADLR